MKKEISKNTIDKAVHKFDPFESINLFYTYNLNIEEFIKQQLLILLAREDSRETSQKTTFYLHNILSFPILKNLRDQIISIIETHNLFLGNSWCQFYNKNDGHPIHIHGESKYSGIIYIDGNEASSTTFYNKNFNTYQHTFKKNSLLLFPSWIPHEVKKLKKDEQRLIISFNTL